MTENARQRKLVEIRDLVMDQEGRNQKNKEKKSAKPVGAINVNKTEGDQSQIECSPDLFLSRNMAQGNTKTAGDQAKTNSYNVNTF